MSDASSQSWTWKQCNVCEPEIKFKNPKSFIQHLREFHCSKEGGSYVCLYGDNDVCSSLPLEGVSDQDYEDHIFKHHVLKKHKDLYISSDEQVHLQEEYKFHSPVQLQYHQPNLLSDQFKWTIYDCSQNLPAALNDPRRLKRENDFFTKTWGDSFAEVTSVAPSPYIPVISFEHFKPFLSKTTKRYRQIKNSASSGSISKLSSEDGFYSFPNAHSQVKLPAFTECIPKIFLQTDFNLENSQTFNAVLPWSQLYPKEDSATASPQKKSSKLLQEKLSHYLDIVEVKIAQQVSMCSEAFFNAMTSRDAVMDQLATVIESVCILRKRINDIKEVLVTGSLKILNLKRKYTNFINVYNILKLMATVHQTQPTIQLLLSTSEFVGALDLIYTTQEVLAQELSGIQSFRHLSSQLTEIEKIIDKMISSDFTRYVSADLNRPLSESNCVMEEERLTAIVFGMLRLHRFSFIEVYKEEACTALKATVKQTVIEVISEADDIDLEGNAGSLADQMRLLDFPSWLLLLKQVFENLKKLLIRIQAIHSVMIDTIHAASGKISSDNNFGSSVFVAMNEDLEVMVTEEEYEKLISTLKDVLFAVGDNAHERCAKLLAARAKDGSLEKLTASEFVSLIQSIEQFSAFCENTCGRRSTALRLILQSQSNRFVTRFHEERKTKLGLILESEQWKQADVPVEFQELVDHISSTGSLTIPKMSSNKDQDERKPKSVLVVDSEDYVVTGTVLLLLKMVVEYCQCSNDIQMVVPDLLTRLLELLKVFNSWTCQLVLGAGALKSVGMKTITTRHLALASRCLQLVVHFIPQVRSHFEQRLPQKQLQMIKHFDQVLKDYNKHIQEISDKLVAIISDMFEVQLLKWEVKAPVPSSCFRAISKHLGKLYDLTSDLLTESQLQEIFQRIHDVFRSKVRHHLVRLQVNNDGGPQHGLVTQELSFYLQKMRSMNIPCDLNHNGMDDLWFSR